MVQTNQVGEPMSAGRNDPCPCNSGKKYKKCCLTQADILFDELFKKKLQQSLRELHARLTEYIRNEYGEESLDEAWAEFHEWDEGAFGIDESELQLFMPWFFFNWIPESSSNQSILSLPKLTPARAFLRSQSSKLDPLQREYIELCNSRGFTFFDLLSVWPGKGFKVKDLLTGEVQDVSEISGSLQAKAGEIFFGKTVTIRGLTTLEACAPVKFTPSLKIDIIKLRNKILKENSVINGAILNEYDMEIRRLYLDEYFRLMCPPPPIKRNTDGDLLVSCKLKYKLHVNADEALRALADLNCAQSYKEILKSAEFKDGKVKAIDFSWLRKEKARKPKQGHTVLGRISIRDQDMVVETNSEKRAQRFARLLKNRLNWKYDLIDRQFRPYEDAVEADGSELEGLDTERPELADPEIQAQIGRLIKSHWETWPEIAVPVLGGLTPIEAVKSPDGREAVDALLTEFELDCEERALPGATKQTFQEIRDRLGL